MFKTHLTIALRNFFRHKLFSGIKVLGLSIGISASLVIYLIAAYEFGFDSFQKDREQLYRVVLDARFNGNEGHSAAVPAPLATAIEQEMPAVQSTIPILQFPGDANAKVEIDKNAGGPVFKKQEGIVFTKPAYFAMLSIEWVAGSPTTALNEPFATVLTEERAKQYFGNLPVSDIIGRKITYNKEITTTVTGVVKAIDEPTAFTASEFISHATIAKTSLQNRFMMNVWDDWMSYSQLYVKLKNGQTTAAAESQLSTLFKKYNPNAEKDEANSIRLKLQPLSDMHFNTNYQSIGMRTAHKPTLYGLLAIAAFLLLIGCINFINLTTANASGRAKEIGIRKTMGSSKMNLVIQFLAETLFLTSIAVVFSLMITPLLVEMFRDFIPAGLHIKLTEYSKLVPVLLVLTLAVSLLAGLYPAFILSSYKPVDVLKSNITSGSGGTRSALVRKILTVSQFTIAQFFLIATVMVSRQIHYSLTADMGFQKDAIVTVELPRDSVRAHHTQLLSFIQAMPGVATAALGFSPPAGQGVSFTNISYIGDTTEYKPTSQIRWGDANYFKVYQIPLVAGRNVLPSDSVREFIVNETFTREIGFKEPAQALNHFLQWNGKSYPVVGVMKDFHDQSFRAHISPVVFAGNKGTTLHVRLHPNDKNGIAWKATLTQMQKQYKGLYPEEEFNIHFYDETIAKLYESETRTAGLLRWAMGLTIVISCLGMLGLVMYTTLTRRKEIGIRKVLGASVSRIVVLLSGDFIKLVLIAFVIAAPVAGWATYQWLQDYAYRVSLSWWVYATCGLVMLVVAMITLSVQTIQAATSNPVKSLRTD
jgi:putative ABC transport system permease protein